MAPFVGTMLLSTLALLPYGVVAAVAPKPLMRTEQVSSKPEHIRSGEDKVHVHPAAAGPPHKKDPAVAPQGLATLTSESKAAPDSKEPVAPPAAASQQEEAEAEKPETLLQLGGKEDPNTLPVPAACMKIIHSMMEKDLDAYTAAFNSARMTKIKTCLSAAPSMGDIMSKLVSTGVCPKVPDPQTTKEIPCDLYRKCIAGFNAARSELVDECIPEGDFVNQFYKCSMNHIDDDQSTRCKKDDDTPDPDTEGAPQQEDASQQENTEAASGKPLEDASQQEDTEPDCSSAFFKRLEATIQTKHEHLVAKHEELQALKRQVFDQILELQNDPNRMAELNTFKQQHLPEVLRKQQVEWWAKVAFASIRTKLRICDRFNLDKVGETNLGAWLSANKLWDKAGTKLMGELGQTNRRGSETDQFLWMHGLTTQLLKTKCEKMGRTWNGNNGCPDGKKMNS